MNFIVNSTIYYVIKDFAHKNEYYRYIPTQNNLLNNHNIMDYYMSAFFNLKNKLKRLCTEKFSFLNRIIPINMQFPMFNYQIQHCQTSNRLILSVIDNFRKDTIYITNISQKAHSTSFSNQYILERLPIMKLTTFLYYSSEIPIFIKVSWIYEIFTELIGLHSYGNVHGNLSLDQIFICYNIYNNYVDVTLLPFPKSHYFNTKNKMKDISDFGKVIYSLFFNHHQSTNHVNERISQLIDFCRNNPSNIFDINHQIHEIIDQSHEKQQIHKFIKQSLIQIPFSLYYIFQIDSFFKNFLQNHRSQVDDIFYWNFQRMISNVNEYINNRIDRKIKTHKNHSYPLVSFPNEIITKLERLCQQEIKKYKKMHTLEKERYKNQINELIFPANFFPHTNYDSYSKVKINSVSKKLNSLSNQIPRTFMLSCLQKKTIDFFIRRYLFQLNPRNSYKIFTIILNTVSRYQNQPIFSDDIKKLCDSLNVKYEVENGRVIMYR
ncbi:hypothetical protein TRFO_25362 [Tritrichomonas foetus]|uniref:Uncharacterized protein n=1 Tax=Tritrichomonas foetus TaxID=1144522 RepID=A0A1J4K6N2_9EUKA|nr:hypothetical protein TRFO_25362 [Tritrichomonas foetus]|eukprot:OHT06552.1 hypothetical protein TRFO_25362 [Tritrichomonas foetus]